MKRISFYTLLLLTLSGLLLTACLKEDENPATGTPNPLAALPVVHALYQGSPLTLQPQLLSGARRTEGVVISNQEQGNLAPGQVVISQDWRGLRRGLSLFLSPEEALAYQEGDWLQLELTGAQLERVDGMLGLTGIQAKDITRLDSEVPVAAAAVDIARLLENPQQFENTLVLLTADLAVFPEGGKTLGGEHLIVDGSGQTLRLITDERAQFGQLRLAPSASFRGILVQTPEGPALRMRTAEDLIEPSGPLYAGYPEDFENPEASVKPSYNMVATDNKVTLATGEWTLFYAILGDIQNRDRHVSGRQAVRVQQNLAFPAYIEMNYDLPKGASKVTFWYGSYFNDQSCTFQLEYSTDQGESWEIIGEPISDAHTFASSPIAKQASFLMDIREPVRFRIHKLGLGPSNGTTVRNGRLGIDDFAVFENY